MVRLQSILKSLFPVYGQIPTDMFTIVKTVIRCLSVQFDMKSLSKVRTFRKKDLYGQISLQKLREMQKLLNNRNSLGLAGGQGSLLEFLGPTYTSFEVSKQISCKQFRKEYIPNRYSLVICFMLHVDTTVLYPFRVKVVSNFFFRIPGGGKRTLKIYVLYLSL